MQRRRPIAFVRRKTIIMNSITLLFSSLLLCCNTRGHGAIRHSLRRRFRSSAAKRRSISCASAGAAAASLGAPSAMRANPLADLHLPARRRKEEEPLWGGKAGSLSLACVDDQSRNWPGVIAGKRSRFAVSDRLSGRPVMKLSRSVCSAVRLARQLRRSLLNIFHQTGRGAGSGHFHLGRPLSGRLLSERVEGFRSPTLQTVGFPCLRSAPFAATRSRT